MSSTQTLKARLYILQHGSAIPKSENPDRPLSPEGHSDIQRLAELLVEKKNVTGEANIERILHSGKLRAEQTAQILADVLDGDISMVPCSGITPNDSAAAFVEEQGLRQATNNSLSKGNVMIVSHMPFVSNLCSVLLTGSTEVEFDFTPGTLVCLFYEYEEWSMEYMIRPEFIR